MMKHFVFSALASLAFASLFAGSVMAGDIYGMKKGERMAGIGSLFGGDNKQPEKKGPPQHPIHDEQTFEQLTTVHTVMPFKRADLYFTMNLPKDWQTEMLPDDKATLSGRIIGDIARFSSPMIGTKRIRVSVQGSYIEHEISSANWLRNYILTSGFAPEGEIITDEKNPRRASIFFVSLDNGESFYNYITAQISGNVMMMARAQVPQNLREYAKFLQKRLIDSFSLTYPKEGPIEPQRTFMMMDAAKMSIPESWENVAQNFKDMNRLSVQLHNKNATGGVDGFIQMLGVRRNRGTNLMKEIDEVKKLLDTQFNLEVTEMESSEESIAYDRFIFNRYEIYNVESRRSGQSKQDLHLVVLGDKEWYLILFLITMREQERLYAWARNVQTLEEIVRSIR
ncbi:MAG: hypothetical protein H3C49_12165 [Alphaproteobacteria bacterium]|nr:hypothetical protein [Alphaproteobacteria bacterium]